MTMERSGIGSTSQPSSVRPGDCAWHDWSDGRNPLLEVCQVERVGKRWAWVRMHMLVTGGLGPIKRVLARRLKPYAKNN